MSHFTRSDKLKACSGWLARLDTSSSAMVVELGGCDHLCADGEGCRTVLAARAKDLDTSYQAEQPHLDRNGHERVFMVALELLKRRSVMRYWMLTRLAADGFAIRLRSVAANQRRLASQSKSFRLSKIFLDKATVPPGRFQHNCAFGKA